MEEAQFRFTYSQVALNVNCQELSTARQKTVPTSRLFIKKNPQVIRKGNALHHVAGNTRTTKPCSDDRVLDAGESVAGAAPSAALLQEMSDHEAINRGRKQANLLHTG
jgi:hypothetical protein